MPNNIVLLGMIGSGKSTLATQLESFGFLVLAPGRLYRSEYEQKTEFGLKAYSYWGNGNLCPDEMTNELMQNIMVAAGSNNLIFDGYPRSKRQAEFLDVHCKIPLVLDLSVSEDTAIKRLLKRKEIDNRSDDTEEIIRQRFIVYNKNNKDMVSYYLNEGPKYRYRLIDAESTIKDTLDNVIYVISTL